MIVSIPIYLTRKWQSTSVLYTAIMVVLIATPSKLEVGIFIYLQILRKTNNFIENHYKTLGKPAISLEFI